MNSKVVNQTGQHIVQNRRIGKNAAFLYQALRDGASSVLRHIAMLVCVVLAVAVLASCGSDKDEPAPDPPTPTDITISGLENLRKASLQVDKEVNLLNGITFGNGASLVKVKIEMDGQTKEISDPYHYVPQYPGICNIVLTVKDNKGTTQDYRVDNVTIKALEYTAIQIDNIRPVDILPIIGQVQSGDKNVYSHIEHLRIAEATRIRDMMWKYGAGSHSAEQYQQLMSRLNTGMIMEQPLGYDNFEIIGGETDTEKTSHAHNQWHILNSIIKHANFKTVSHKNKTRQANLQSYINDNPNSINVFWCSAYEDAYNKNDYNKWLLKQDIIDLCNQKNFIIFTAGTNIEYHNGVIINQIYNGEYAADDHGNYSLASLSNSDKNTLPNSHLFVTIATEADGDIDQTNETITSTKVPRHIHPLSLFSGRAFPYKDYKSGKIVAEGGGINKGKYSTSYTGPLNACMADLCFQMFAEVQDVDQLLNMIRSTSLTDYIRFNGETQQLQLISPAGFFKKYCMPTGLPTLINTTETVSLNKGYYKGVIFEIPGAEVKISGQWIAYNDANKSVIKGQNPFSLEWRINGDLCRKMGYQGKTATGKVIVVDDQWNGLNISSDFNVNIQ